MKKILSVLLVVAISFAQGVAQKDTAFPVIYFSTVPNITIRALEALSGSTVWFAANHGVWGYTENGGKSWHIDSLRVDSVCPVGQDPKPYRVYPEFRSISVLNDSTVLLLSIASPAYLFKTTNKGKTWRIVYTNRGKDIFFDSMKFRDEKKGIAVGDPIDGCFQVITTEDGGETWKQTDCSHIPSALEGEALFASSNSNIYFSPLRVLFATGGSRARIFQSSDEGEHFNEVFETPVARGEKLTGIFSMHFSGEEYGVVTGGNYEKTDSAVVSLAITKDMGYSWEKINTCKPFFGSCVQMYWAYFWITGHDGTFLGHTITRKIMEVKDQSGKALKFHTMSIPEFKKTAVWLAGDKGRLALINLKK